MYFNLISIKDRLIRTAYLFMINHSSSYFVFSLDNNSDSCNIKSTQRTIECLSLQPEMSCH